MSTNESETIDITPSPRILEVLGEVDMSPEECFAEFIDNSVDEGVEGTPGRGNDEDSGDPLWVAIELPSEHNFKNDYENAEVVIQDNGPGMSREELEKNLRAGYSDKNPIDEMGLFGMGFNIATARLGNRTTVKTTREGDEQWAVTTIDFRDLTSRNEFEVEVEYEDKKDSSTHGTIIQIKRLNEMASSLKKKWKMPETLGDWYSTVLQRENVEIILDGEELDPRPHCTWSRQRCAEVGGEEIPAKTEVQDKVGEGYYCKECWNWIEDQFGEVDSEDPKCLVCDGEGDVVHREQIVWGWLGIQRFFDKEDYGIDLIRNGRVIEKHDKSFFYWENPEGKEEKEYPIDATHWGGRIIGELHIDFVPVSNTKDKFDRSNPRWKKVREAVRGEGPLRPQIASNHGYEEPNRSPLALLYKGFRYGKPPGKKHLVPGDFDEDGNLQGGDNSKAREMAEKFWNGEEEYQDDTKWWELVERAERAQRESSPGSDSNESGDSSGSSTTTDDGGSAGVNLNPEGDAGGVVVGDSSEPDGDQEGEEETTDPDNNGPAVQREFERDEELSGTYGLDDIGEPDIEFNVLRLTEGPLESEPIEVERESWDERTIRYDPGHPFFTDFDNKPIMTVLMEAASTFRTRMDDPGDWRQTRLFSELQEKYCEDQRVSPEGLAARAQDQLRHVKELISREQFDLQGYEVSDDVVEAVREKVLRTVGQGDETVEDLLVSSAYLEYAPHRELVRYFEENPEQFFDGTVWEQSYSTLGSDNLKKRSVDKFAAYLNDVIMLAEEATEVDPSSARPARRIELDRAAQSLRLLEAESATS